MNPSSDRIKVLHIITRFDKGGSAENTFLTICGLDPGRYEVLLVKGSSGTGKDGPEDEAAEANIAAAGRAGVRLLSVDRLVRNLRPLSDLSAFLSLIRIIRLERPRIIHTHTSKAGILGRWAAWLCRVPSIVHTPHGHVFWAYFGPFQTRLFILLERWTARITDAIVTLTAQEKEDHIRFRIAPEAKFTVIHSGVDLKPFLTGPSRAEARHLLGLPPRDIVVATVGRLAAVKGQEVLIRAVSELIARGERILLVVQGAGELRRNLEDLAGQLGIARQVRFLGWRPDVAPLLAACDLFGFPSRNEGMGKVLVEAMAMGRPIVASDVGGIRDLVSPGVNGLLAPVGDIGAWVEAIARLSRDPETCQRMGSAGQRMASRYSSEAMIKKIDQLYGTLLNEYRTVGP